MVTDLLLTKTELLLREGLPKVPSAVYRLVCVYKGREENKDVAASLDLTLKAKLASHLPPSSPSLQKAPGAKHQSCLRQKEILCD